MKRPKVGPPSLGILGFFGRKPKVTLEQDGKLESPLGNPEETHISLMPEEEEEEEEEEGLLECPLCLLPQPPAAFPALSCCSHLSCLTCLQQYLRIEISESRVQVACPHCPALLQPSEIHQLLPEANLGEKYEEYLLRRLLVADPGTRWCPAPDCSYAVIAYGCAECPRLVCGRQDCRTEFCYHCRQPWHPNSSCEQAWREWSRQAPGAVELSTQLIQKEEAALDTETIKVCPRCGAFIMKINDGSCNRMNCTVCGCLFCWLCLREITDVHFLSPSGCTFWGKKPWSRTRKLLWQLGMVLGAPMVISIVAGIAVPVITLGIPIYMGKKVLSHGRKSKLSVCQQCLSVSSSIILSLFVSPVITAVTVGVGVPLMLTYVYGVVALSLCRNRWGCGGTRRKAGELSMVELENLAKSAWEWTGGLIIPRWDTTIGSDLLCPNEDEEYKVNELLSVLPTQMVSEAGNMHAATAATSLHSTGHSLHDEPPQNQRDSQSASTVALAGSMLSEGQEASYRDGLNFEVEVEVEPQASSERSLCSAASGHSFSTDSLACTSEGCSSAGAATE